MTHPSKDPSRRPPELPHEQQPSQGHLLLELAARVHRLEDEVERLLMRTVDLEAQNRSENDNGWAAGAPARRPAAPSAPPTPPAPIEIVRNGLAVTPEADRYLQERLAQLHRFYRPIISKRVVLEGPVGHHQTGGPFTVDLYLDVPGRMITVTHQHSDDLHVAIRATFDAAQRQLEDHARKQRAEVSPTVAPPRGRVIRLFPEAGYGFIAAAGDGHEVYFHRNSVLGDSFEELNVGDEVRFAEEQGEHGPQASTVALPGE